MARYPTSVLQGTAAQALATVLLHHLPQDKGPYKVLDPCYGKGHWWDARLSNDYHVHPSDILPPWNQDVRRLFADRPDMVGAFDAVVYDPPYLVGTGNTDDPREGDYGGYAHSEFDLLSYINALSGLVLMLKPNGVLIVKCQDQYVVPERKLHLWHADWLVELDACDVDVVDFYVYPYHRASPTAYQVKDRPCAVVGHSYLLVARRLG